LLKHNDRLIGITTENSTQTDPLPDKMSHSCRTSNKNNSSQTDPLPTENSTQTDLIPTKISHNCKTQTENNIQQKCITVNDNSNVIEIMTDNTTQMDPTIIVENETDLINKQKNAILSKFDNNIFKAKVTIVCGYNFPMVQLHDDIVPTAPTTYVIMEGYSINNLSTSSVVQQTNPVWNSVWTVILPKNTLIEVCINK